MDASDAIKKRIVDAIRGEMAKIVVARDVYAIGTKEYRDLDLTLRGLSRAVSLAERVA